MDSEIKIENEITLESWKKFKQEDEVLIAEFENLGNGESETVPHFLFRLAGKIMATKVQEIDAVIEPTPVTEIPGAPEFFKGVLSRNQKTYSLIDLRMLWSIGDNKSDFADSRSFMLATAEEGNVALAVDYIVMMVDIPVSGISNSKSLSEFVPEEFITSTLNVNNRIVPILNLLKFNGSQGIQIQQDVA